MEQIKEKIKNSYTAKLSRYIYRNFFNESSLAVLFSLSFLFNLILLVLVSIKGRPEEAKIPLHYILGQGIDKVVPWYEIYYIPFFVFFINIINLLGVRFLYNRNEKAVAYFLASANLVFVILSLFASYLIVFKI